MNDDDLRRIYANARKSQPPSGDRPALEELQQLVDGDLSGDEREVLLDRVLSDPATTRELAMLQAVSKSKPRARRWLNPRMLTLAAAAAVVVAVTPLVLRSRDDATPVYRAGDPALGEVQIVSPAEGTALAAGVPLAWHPVPDADRYVVEIVSSSGDAIARITTRDTALVVPDSISAARLDSASGWMLVAMLRDGAQRQSVMRVLPKRAP